MWSTNKLKKYQDDFLIRIAELTESGFTQYEAVEFLFGQYDGINKDIKQHCLQQLKEGRSLSHILTYLNYSVNVTLQIYFGEQFSDIQLTLRQCHAFNVSKRESLRQFLKTVQYPLVLLIIFFALIMVVNQTVLPQFQGMYESMDIEISRELKMMTTLLFVLPRILLTGGVITGVLIGGYFFYFKKASVAKKLYIIRRLPVVRSLYRKYITYRVSLELSFFLGNGVAMIKIIELFSRQQKDPVIQFIGESINQELLKGHSLPEAVRKVGLFEKSMINFISHGEKNARLDIELKYYAEYIFQKFEAQVLGYVKWIQPIVFALLGLLIVTLYLVIILPMLQMMSGIQS